MTTTDTTNKPFMIEKWRVYEAYKAVKFNKGAAVVDGQTIEQFEADLKGNLSPEILFQGSIPEHAHHRQRSANLGRSNHRYRLVEAFDATR
jgi:hypothetical protein